ncbi:TPA: universal stress protein [Elizabethkingia anophelis]|nr:universal stress protein [Elizabethkingia anophelis]
MNRIIVATDYSATGQNAMLYAAEAAAKHNIELVLFHLHNISIHALNARLSVESMDSIFQKAKDNFEDSAYALSQTFGIKVIRYFASGDIYTELSACAETWQAEMLVMGMSDKSLEQQLMGNTTTKVIHRLKIPVLAVPENLHYTPVKNILYACDFDKDISGEFPEKLRDFASVFGAQIEIFTVESALKKLQTDDAVEERKLNMDNGLEGISHYYKNVLSDNVVAAIKEEIVNTQADLLVMVPHKYGFWESVIHRSKTSIMASGSNIPLLSIPVDI